MKTTLEVFYLRVAGTTVRYQRKEMNLSRKGSDPDQMIWASIRQKGKKSSSAPEGEEYIVHSTSWRYTPPDRVVLTYITYSDELRFTRGKSHSLSLKKLRNISKESRHPRARAELEKKVVSHAMRHLAFLIQTDSRNEFKKSLKPETVEIFEKLWADLAGQVLEKA